ncbi:bacteriocin-like protein [Chryseobacterium cucumeris]|uniref:bacteriocin-like protein n=1 Tax=Chryseobacterium cucumeris TaxID=1813611 RepID=UPI003D979F1A
MKKLKKLSRNDLKKVAGGTCSQWVGVTAPCGASYSLCTDNYSNWAELQEAAEYFNDVKC